MKTHLSFPALVFAALVIVACGKEGAAPLDTDGLEGRKRAFVSSGTFDGAMGGVNGADNRCTSIARNAGLSGRWMAFLAAPGTPVLNRLPNVGPWYFVDRTTLVFRNHAHINENIGPATSVLNMTEFGTIAGGTFVWSGSNPNGTPTSDTCQGWTSNNGGDLADVGSVLNGGINWTTQVINGCASFRRMYCFEL